MRNFTDFTIHQIFFLINIITMKRPCSSDGGKTKIIFHPGWKAGWEEIIGKTETSLGGQY